MKRLVITLVIMITGAVLFQGFQCTSPEMSTAKIAYRDQDYVKAKAKFEEEIKKRPQNGEAWMFLADIEAKFKNFEKASQALTQAKKTLGAKSASDQMVVVETAIWVGAYNKSFSLLAEFKEKNDNNLLDSAILFMSIAREIRPYNPEIHRILAIAYENYNKEEEALASYDKFVEIMKPSVDYAKAKGIYIGQPIFEVAPKVGGMYGGPPEKLSDTDPDSLRFFFSKDDKYETFLFFSDTKRNGKFILKGWAVNQPENLSRDEKSNWRQIITNPYLALAEIYFKKKDYDKSMEYIMTVSAIEPFNSTVNDYIVQIYQEQGKKEEALNVIKQIVDKNPNNSYYIQRYADILATFEKWDEAAKNYEKAIAIDKDSKDAKDISRAYQNLGVCFKNIAATIYSKQKELADKNLKPLDPKEYEPYLNKSEENFRKALTYQEQKDNIDILNDLSDIYYLINKESDLKDIIQRMEFLEPKMKEKDAKTQLKYYNFMIKIYDRTDQNYTDEFFKTFPQKLEKITKEMEKL